MPAWLDLDAIISAPLRDRIRGVAAQLDELAPAIEELERESIVVRTAYHDAINAAKANELLDLVSAVTGYDAFFEAWMSVAERACNITESVPV